MAQKKCFLTFGGPSDDYHNAVNRLCNEVRSIGLFHQIIGQTELDLKADEEFWKLHGEFIENNPRGYGYWLWKPYLVKKQLETMNENDILLYCDSGCQLNPYGLLRLHEYFGMVNLSEFGILSFQMTHPEYIFTKMDTIVELNCNEHMNSGQLVATAFIIRKIPHTIDLVNKWYNACCNYHILDDSKSIIENHAQFYDHRHDQSIFSILRKKYGTILLNDETFFIDWYKDGIQFPIWATRRRCG